MVYLYQSHGSYGFDMMKNSQRSSDNGLTATLHGTFVSSGKPWNSACGKKNAPKGKQINELWIYKIISGKQCFFLGGGSYIYIYVYIWENPKNIII